MKNVTITLSEDVARWARVWAARHDTSMSRMVGELLRRHMEEEEGYAAAGKSFLEQAPLVLRDPTQPYPRRGELHDR